MRPKAFLAKRRMGGAIFAASWPVRNKEILTGIFSTCWEGILLRRKIHGSGQF
jgi:hypothetical protein